MNERAGWRHASNRWIFGSCLYAVSNCSAGVYEDFRDDRLREEAAAEKRPLPPRPPRSQRLLKAMLESMTVAAAAWGVTELIIPRRKKAGQQPP